MGKWEFIDWDALAEVPAAAIGDEVPAFAREALERCLKHLKDVDDE